MQQVMIELPEDLARQVGLYQGRLQELVLLGLSQLKTQEALMLYARGIATFARAGEIAGLSGPEMIRQARGFGIRPRWSEQMVDGADAGHLILRQGVVLGFLVHAGPIAIHRQPLGAGGIGRNEVQVGQADGVLSAALADPGHDAFP